MNDFSEMDEMIANAYTIFVGTRKSISVTKQAFDYAGVSMCNMIFYPIRANKKTENAILPVSDLELKIEILRNLHIL